MEYNSLLKNYGVESSSIGAQFICDAALITLRDMSDENIPCQINYLKEKGFTSEQINSSIERHAGNYKNYMNFKQDI